MGLALPGTSGAQLPPPPPTQDSVVLSEPTFVGDPAFPTIHVSELNATSGPGGENPQVTDGQPDTFGLALPGRAPTDCSPSPFGQAPILTGDITVVDAEPAPLTSKDQCKEGGWEQFGFKNQGQCVAFVQRPE
jgi:hypothetical protein